MTALSADDMIGMDPHEVEQQPMYERESEILNANLERDAPDGAGEPEAPPVQKWIDAPKDMTDIEQEFETNAPTELLHVEPENDTTDVIPTTNLPASRYPRRENRIT